MKYLVIVLLQLLSISAFAEMWESKTYTDYTIVAEKKEIKFRFSEEGGYGVCETGVVFDSDLLKITDSTSGSRHRIYLQKGGAVSTGNSGACNGDGPIILSERVQVVKSKWYKVEKGHSVTIIVPYSMTIELN
jgi:hypothetical protein